MERGRNWAISMVSLIHTTPVKPGRTGSTCLVNGGVDSREGAYLKEIRVSEIFIWLR